MNRMTLSSVLMLAFSFVALVNPEKMKVKSPLFKNFKLIEGGTVFFDTHAETVAPFYISATEVSNLQYKQFLASLKEQRRLDELAIAQLDTAQWKQLSFGEPLMKYYHFHPAYDNYPCVNMSHEGAKLYCRWLEEMLTKADPRFTFEVKLPSKKQWIFAAQGGKKNAVYSWDGPYMTTHNGLAYCNFKNIGANNIHFDEVSQTYVVKTESQTNENTAPLNPSVDLTAPVVSYMPNGYGLYNVCGNVAEMIDQKGIAMGGSFNSTGYDVRIRSQSAYSTPMPTVGFRPVIVLKVKQ